ncbi:MAG: ATP-binding protein [Chloroflexota bacterium]|nr:ATP-binding protein [Chloroflexota bacterium]
MKISIRNLGAVREAEIDLKPLTIFIGPNSSGKTWTAYLLSGIFGPYGFQHYLRESNIDQIWADYPTLEKLFQQVNARRSARINLVEFADQHGEAYFNGVAGYAKEWMPRFLATERGFFDDLTVSVDFAATKERVLETLRKAVVTRSLSSIKSLKEKDQELLYFYSESDLTEADAGEVYLSQDLPTSVIKRFLAESIFQPIHRALFPDTYVFPAERTTFITFPFDGTLAGSYPVQRSNSASEELFDSLSDLTKPSRRSKQLAIPIANFLSMVSRVYSVSARGGSRRSNAATKDYAQLADLLEKTILIGGIEFSTPEPQPGRELLFRTANDIAIEIPIASSMVKELTPLVLYLRYLAKAGDLVVIDEPEMNLHPEAQARLSEFLGMLVNAGLYIIVTSHSPYIVDHLANVIRASENKNQKAIRNQFFLKRNEAFIRQDQVSVYLFDKGTATSVLTEDGLVEWGTFSDVSDRSNRIYFSLDRG